MRPYPNCFIGFMGGNGVCRANRISRLLGANQVIGGGLSTKLRV